MSVATAWPPSTEPGRELPAGLGGYVAVDLGAVVENWRRIGRLVGPGCAVSAVVKADAYGLGMAPVARALAEAGCRWFFVATPEEGLALAAAFAGRLPEARIAVLSGPDAGLLADGILLPVLNDLGQVARWRAEAPGRPAILHVDTGMGRLGMPPAEAARLAAFPELLAGLPVAAVMSHLACPDEPEHPLNEAQRRLFIRLASGLPPAPRSLSASYGCRLGPAYHLDLVRPGAALYGLNLTPGATNPMRPVLRLAARILQLRELKAGDTVGYGATWMADRPRRIATLGVGYADGIPRAAGNAGSCVIGGHVAPFVGRVSMDLLTIDVTGIPEPLVRPGGFIDVVGPESPIETLAGAGGAIGYELLTRLGPRLPRLHHGFD
jgi:alanine racemase